MGAREHIEILRISQYFFSMIILPASLIWQETQSSNLLTSMWEI